MKIITIYGLLGKIYKFNEDIPKLIKFDNYIWKYDEESNDYSNDEAYLFQDYIANFEKISDYLHCFAEIIEENKKIEKFNYCIEDKFNNFQNGMTQKDRVHLDSNFQDIEFQLNELIDKVNELESRDNEC